MGVRAILLLLATSALAPGALADERAEDPTKAARLEDVLFEGRAYFKETTLRSFLRHEVPAPLDEALLESDRRALETRYVSRGFLRAKVRLELVAGAAPAGRIARFVIDAGKRPPILSVDVLGNHRVDDDELRAGFFSRPTEPLGFLTLAGLFHKPYLDQDGQRLLRSYYERGFLEARIERTRVAADADLEGLRVTFDVHEGPIYELAGLSFAGEPFEETTQESLRAQISVKDGDTADLVRLQREADALLDPIREQGYPFARFEQEVKVAPPPSGRKDRRAVALTLRVVKGPRSVVRKVRIVGDPGAMEHVIRREVTVEEGKPYRHSELAVTQRKLMALGFFQQVLVQPVPSPTPGEVDVEIQSTRALTWVAGPNAFLTERGPVVFLVLGDRNLFGTGVSALVMTQLAFYGDVLERAVTGEGSEAALQAALTVLESFDVTLTEPHLLGSDVALTVEGHRRQLFFSSFRIRSEVGGGVRASFPLGLGFQLGVGGTSELSGVAPYDALPLAKSALFPERVLRNVVDASLSWDSRDLSLGPRNGALAQLSASYTGPFTLSEVSAVSLSGRLRLYWTPLLGITLKSNTDVAFVANPLGDDVAVTERFFVGGFGSVRGYSPKSLSPTRLLDGNDASALALEVGGVFKLVQNLELDFPLWPETPLRGFLFVDAGNTFDDDEAWFSSKLERQTEGPLPLGLFWSVGAGVLIETPAAPIRFEVSVPLTRRPRDRAWEYFAGVGSSF